MSFYRYVWLPAPHKRAACNKVQHAYPVEAVQPAPAGVDTLPQRVLPVVFRPDLVQEV